MKDLSSFMSRILPHVTGCPDVLAEEALLDTAIEFCEKTLIIQKTLDPMSARRGASEYELDAPSDQEVILPVSVWFKTRKLVAVPADNVWNVQAFNLRVPGTDAVEGEPTAYFWVANRTIGVYPVPEETHSAAITVRAALKPKRTATQLEDALFDDWIDPMVTGTLARLHAMKDQAWSSADRALLRSREFRASVQRARMEGSVGRVRGNLSVRMRSF